MRKFWRTTVIYGKRLKFLVNFNSDSLTGYQSLHQILLERVTKRNNKRYFVQPLIRLEADIPHCIEKLTG